MFTDNITKCQNKIFLVIFALQKIYTAGCRIFFQELCCQAFIFLFYILKRWTYYIFRIIRVAEQFNRRINIIFQVTEANDFTETFLLVQYSVGTTECLQQTVIFHILIHIKCVQFFTVKTSKEHSHDKTKVKRFHIRFLLFHAQIDVIIVGTEVFCSKSSAEHIVIIVHNCLQFISLTHTLFCILPCTHAGLFIIQTIVGSVSKHSTYTDFRIQRFEYLVISYEHRHGLHSKQGIKLSVECGFVEIVKDKLGDFLHTSLIVVVNNFVAVIILHKESKHVFIGYGILNKIFMKTISEYLLSGMPIYRIFSKNRCSREAKDLSIVKELHNLLMTIPKVATMTLIKYHHDT